MIIYSLQKKTMRIYFYNSLLTLITLYYPPFPLRKQKYCTSHFWSNGFEFADVSIHISCRCQHWQTHNYSPFVQSLPEREPLQLPWEPLLLPRLSPLVRMEMPEKLLALVTGGRSVRLELSESVLLQGRGSRHFMSLSVLLWRLLDARLELSRFPLRGDTMT